jgi:DNA polymerase-3 subunit alpha
MWGVFLKCPYGQVDRIAKLIPNNPAKPTTIAQAVASEEELRKQRREDEQVADLIDVSMKLEGALSARLDACGGFGDW